MQNEEKKAFYEECGKILNITHEWNDPVPRRTRWNARLIGNGRFPGFGLIRCYGYQIMVTSKDGTKMFDTREDVYKYLAEIMPL